MDSSSSHTSSRRNSSACYNTNSNEYRDIGLWDTSQVQNMNFTFAGAASFVGNIYLWNISSVNYMENMFDGATAFPGVDWYNSSSKE
jgi:Mycoplasma protein of unknown function, DUF285